jgi:multidrug efflux pump subunit AcrA (membrane-fusion protein)
MHALQGFGVGFLLQLNRIKAVDGKTTLLEFCLEHAMDQSATLPAMATALTRLQPASRFKIKDFKTAMEELQSGYKQAKAAIRDATQLASEQSAEQAEEVRMALLC